MTESHDNKEFDGVYVISVAAHMVGMHPQTLRMYERVGLLSPKRTGGKSRRYSDEDIKRLLEIQELTQDLGVNLAGARLIIEMRERLAHLEDLVVEIEEKRDRLETEMEQEIERIKRSYSREIVRHRPGGLSKY
ncbi:MAG: helix-turn-helix transcriptional regulator [Thermoleophilia bacterium]